MTNDNNDLFSDLNEITDIKFDQLSLIENGNLSKIELESLHRVSECIIEMRSIIRNKTEESNLSTKQLDFFYEALDACHNIPRIIAENNNSLDKTNDLDWLLESNIKSINLAFTRYADSVYFELPELPEIKTSKLPYIVLGVAVTTIVFSLIIIFLYLTDGFKPNYYKSNFENLELPKYEYEVSDAEPDPKFIEKEKEK